MGIIVDSEAFRQRADAFCAEALRLADEGITDFAPLYAKYPDIRIGIRRALFWAEKKRRQNAKNRTHS